MNKIDDDYWEEIQHGVYDAICCNTSMLVRSNGSLYMEYGLAQDFAEMFPSIPPIWGFYTKNIIEGKLRSNIIVTNYGKGPFLVSIPVKQNWDDPIDINLLRRSIVQLYAVSQSLGWKSVLVPIPDLYYDEEPTVTLEQLEDTFDTLLDDKFTIISAPN